MEVKKKIVIEVEGEEADNLKSALEKMHKELTTPGFNHKLIAAESDIIKKLTENMI